MTLSEGCTTTSVHHDERALVDPVLDLHLSGAATAGLDLNDMDAVPVDAEGGGLSVVGPVRLGATRVVRVTVFTRQ